MCQAPDKTPCGERKWVLDAFKGRPKKLERMHFARGHDFSVCMRTNFLIRQWSWTNENQCLRRNKIRNSPVGARPPKIKRRRRGESLAQDGA